MESSILRVVELEVGTADLRARMIDRQGTRVTLTTKEAALLGYLAARPGKVVSLEELHQNVWGYSDKVLSRAAQHVTRRLRMKIEIDHDHPRHLVTVRGEGLRFLP